MEQKELNSILELHRKWLYNEESGERANLREADLREADLHGANLDDSTAAQTVIVPEGQIIGWKKVRAVQGGFNIREAIVKLLIPGDAKRCNATGRKCRASKAFVLEITTLDNKPFEETDIAFCSYNEPTFEYKVGEMVYPDSFDENRWDECSHGIHFFITRQEAVDY